MEREPDTGGNLEEKPFLEHLEDLRRMFLKILLAWGLASLIAFLFSSQILAVAQGPLFRMLKSLGRGEEVNFVLKSLGPTEVFLMSLKLSFLAGSFFRP
jgi:sec-independent protein translocase protein TatC